MQAISAEIRVGSGGRVSFRDFGWIAVAVFLLLAASSAQAILLHPGVAEPTDRPSDAVVGRWGTNASAVAIGRQGWDSTAYILTTIHQGGGVGSRVWFGGGEYVVAEQWVAPSGDRTADLRVCRLVNTAANGGGEAALRDFALWNTDVDETGRRIVLGGYGKICGASGADFYSWFGTSNTALHWGENAVEEVLTGIYNGSTRSDLLRIDFDGPETTDAAIAEWDSGGGWFLQREDGTWVLAALGAYVEAIGRSYYVAPSNDNYGIRVRTHAAWIDGVLPSTVPEPALLTLLGLGGGWLALRRRS